VREREMYGSGSKNDISTRLKKMSRMRAISLNFVDV